MAEQYIKFKISADDEASKVFKEIGENAKEFDGQANSLSKTLKTLAGAATGLFAFREVAQFIKDSTDLFQKEELAETRLAISRKRNNDATVEQVKSLIDYSNQLQRVTRFSNDEIISSMGILSAVVKEDEALKKISKSLLDATEGISEASGETEDLTGLSQALMRSFTMGVGALGRYSLGLSDADKKAFELGNNTDKVRIITEALDRQYGGTAERMGDTYAGQMAQATNAWEDLKKEIGLAAFMMANPLIEAFQKTIEGFNESGKAGVRFYKIMSGVTSGVMSLSNVTIKAIEWTKIGWNSKVEVWWEKAKQLTASLLRPWPFDLTEGQKNRISELEERVDFSKLVIEEANKSFMGFLNNQDKDISNLRSRKMSWEDIIGGTGKFPKLLEELSSSSEKEKDKIKKTFDDLSSSSEKEKDKIKKTFDDLAKSVVDSFAKQTEAIEDIKKALKDLSSDTADQLKQAEEAFNQEKIQMARQSQERINQIDKEIEESKKSMQQGWRDKISELTAEKEKEKAIISRIGQDITNIQDEIAKDELAILAQKHNKEIAEIKSNALKKETELGKDWWALEIGRQNAAQQITAPGFFPNAVSADQNKKSWQPTTAQNIFNFSFGNVTDKDALTKQIIDAINRASELKQFAGT